MKVCIHGEGPYQKKVILRDCEIFGNLHLTFVSSSIVYSPGCGQEERCRQDNHKHCPIRASESWYILPVEDRGMSEPDNIQYYFSPVIISKYNILTDKRYLSVTRRLCSMYASNSNTRVTIGKLLYIRKQQTNFETIYSKNHFTPKKDFNMYLNKSMSFNNSMSIEQIIHHL